MATVNDGRNVVNVLKDQIWEDNDPRQTGARRRIKIIGIKGVKVVVENVKTGRITEISLTRFRPTATGYKLVSQ